MRVPACGKLVAGKVRVVLALAVVGAVVLCCSPWYSTVVRGAQWKAFKPHACKAAILGEMLRCELK